MLIQIRPALAALVCILLAFCATAQSRTASENRLVQADSASAPQKTAGDVDSLYRPLNDVDLSQYKSAGDGLLLIAHRGEFDLLLTKPGHPYSLPAMGWAGIHELNTRSNLYSFVRNKTETNPWSDWNQAEFSGYMLRWKKRKRDPVPYVGRLKVQAEDGDVRVFSGMFGSTIYKSKLFGQNPSNLGLFVEGMSEARESSGKLIWKHYLINHYWYDSLQYAPDSYEARWAVTDRIISNQNGTKTLGSGLPQFEFLLPHPARMIALDSWGWGHGGKNNRFLFTRAYSLADLLRERKINPDHLLLKPFNPIKEKNNFSRMLGDKLHIRSHVNDGESAFLYSAETGKTYLVPYSKTFSTTPVLTLPSLKDIVINGQLPANRQCMGKTEGIVVLTGQCDPAAPVFPLTVMTQVSDNQYTINVWSDINRRSSYLLTGGQFPKQDFYRWNVDAFMVSKTVDPAATLVALRTGEDPFSEKMIAFATQGRDQQVCDKMTAAVSNAEDALRFNPNIDGRLADYERRYQRDWADLGEAVDEFIRNSHHSTPEWDFQNKVWDDLVKMKEDVGQRLTALKRYKDVKNSVCQPDPARMAQLVSALDTFHNDLSSSMKQLDDTYYNQAIERTKEIRNMAGRVQEAKRQYNQQMAMSQLMSRLHSSMQADLAARRAETASIARSMRESREAVEAQIADVKARNQAYFSNSKPVMSAPQTKMIVPVAMPSQSLDTTAHTKVYTGGKIPNRLGFQGAIAQAQAKTDRLANPRSTTIAGSLVGAGTASPATSAPGARPSADGPGGAAVCVATERNANNTPTDVAYYYAYDPHITSLKADKLARQRYGAEHSGTPHCMHNGENQIGALVVIEWDGKDDKGATIRLYGLGFGTSTDRAERDAVDELRTNRNWEATSKVRYRIVYAKQY